MITIPFYQRYQIEELVEFGSRRREKILRYIRIETLNRLDIDDSSGFGDSADISLEVEIETLVQKNGDDIIIVNRLDKSIDKKVADMLIAIYQTKKESIMTLSLAQVTTQAKT